MPVDSLSSPWSPVEGGGWSAVVRGHVWALRPDAITPTKFRVYRDGELASLAIRSLGVSARWAEARFERAGRSLRGPLPKRNGVAVERLPDFRVSAEEREILLRRSANLGIPYATYGRGALLALEGLFETGQLTIEVKNNEVVLGVPSLA